MSSRRPCVGGNWKMNGRLDDVTTLASEVAAGAADGADVVVFPAFPHLAAVAEVLRGSPVRLGAQDVYPEADGAFTGEISTGMLQDLGVSVVLVGHSERRHVINESEEQINAKARAVLASGLDLMLCVGETEGQRQSGRTNAVNAAQVNYGLAGVERDALARVTIAYEPVWAIGTGLTATPDDAQDAHAHIRATLGQVYTPADAAGVRILYGGSVKPDNAAALFAGSDVDGGLIGGASLVGGDFNAIVGHAAAG